MTEFPGHVALLEWNEAAGIADVIADELVKLGYATTRLRVTDRIPPGIGFLFTYGPYGKLLPFLAQTDGLPPTQRPVTIHWNTEGIPDLRLPWPIVKAISHLRSRGEDWLNRRSLPGSRPLDQVWPFSLLNSRILRFRFLGDLLYAYRRGWVHVVADTSHIYATIRSRNGLPTSYAPWGVTPRWYEQLDLERTIDVVWMGKRATRRRSALLNRVRQKLAAHGVQMHIADNVENPFVFDAERTRLLNQAKITLNLTRTWYDDNFSRFTMAAPNGSLVVSEPMLPHCPQFEPGVHYVTAPAEQLADSILYYLSHEEERAAIVANCRELVMCRLQLGQSVATMMAAAEARRGRSRAVPV